MSRFRDVSQFIEKLEKRGLHVWLRNNGHYAIQAPDGSKIYMSATPNNDRGIKRTISLLRRHGFEFKER